MIYRLHFEPKFGHAGHYTGYTENVEARIRLHMSGRGAKLVKYALQAGCQVTLASVQPGGRKEERRIKNRGGASRLCSVCKTRLNQGGDDAIL